MSRFVNASPSTFRVGVAYALGSAMTFGLSGGFGKSLLNAGYSPGAVVGMRMLTAAAVLMVPTLLLLRGKWAIVKRHWGPVLGFALIAVAGCQFFYFNAAARMNVGVALVLEFLAPVLFVLWLWVRHRARPQNLTIAGSVLALIGLVVVVNPGGDRGVDPIGVVFGLAAAVCLVFYFVIAAGQTDGVPPLALAGLGTLIGGVTLTGLGLLGVLPLTFGNQTAVLAGFDVPWWVSLLGIAVISTAIPYATGIVAAQKLGPKMASFVGLAEVVFSTLGGWLLLSEVPQGMQLLGAIIIAAGIVLVRLDDIRVGRRVAAEPNPTAAPAA